jgi:hypothetical protein
LTGRGAASTLPSMIRLLSNAPLAALGLEAVGDIEKDEWQD